MTSKFGRHLSDGLAAHLEFDYACNRGHAFSEYHVHGVVNEILSANIDPNKHRLHAGYAHPAIARAKGGSGRQREVDFHIEDRSTNDSLLCVEVKWAASSHASPKNCLSDVLRLAAIKDADPTAECLFVLVGGITKVTQLIRKSPIAAPGGHGRRLLGVPEEGKVAKKRTYVTRENGTPLPHIATEVRNVPSTPDRFHTTLITPASLNPKRFQTLIWRVES